MPRGAPWCTLVHFGVFDTIPRMDEVRVQTEFLNTLEAATFLNVSERYLKKLRNFNRGPKYINHGDIIRYSRESLNRYAKAMEVATSNRWPRNVEE